MIASSAASAWHSVHVHYAAPQEPLLVACVGPLVASLRARGLSRWFFLRYWKGGPHVRLRFQLDAGAPPALWDEALAAIGGYLRERPSQTDLALDRLEASQRLLSALEGEPAERVVVHPNNTLVAAAYEPEHGKYGGPAGVALAESFFDASSDIAVGVLGGAGGGSGGRVNLALATMLTALGAAGYDEREMARLLADYTRFCERFVPPETWPSLQAKVRRPDVLRQFGGALDALGATGARRPWLERWRAAFGDAARALRACAGGVLPAVTLAKTMDPLQFVLFNYLHTHNNRLGVTPAVEAQVAYLAHHAVAHHAGHQAEDVRA